MVEGRSGSNATGPADRPRQYCPGGGNYVFRGGFKMPRVMHIPPQVTRDRGAGGQRCRPQQGSRALAAVLLLSPTVMLWLTLTNGAWV